MKTTAWGSTLALASLLAVATPRFVGDVAAEDPPAPPAPGRADAPARQDLPADEAPPPRRTKPEKAPTPDDLPSPERVAPGGARAFPTPDAAVDAFVAALAENDDAALRALLGPASEDLAATGDDASVRRRRHDLAAAARDARRFESRPDGRVVVLVGRMEHPLAVPLVRRETGWSFDGEAGREELLARRVGENELEAIGLCLAWVAAQREYARTDRDGDGVREYARRILSTPGNRDGLYWEAEPGEEQSPAGGDLGAFLEGEGDVEAARRGPFNGYVWRMLHAQGAHAPGGAGSWLVGDDLVRGAALLAVPERHGNTGVVSFLASVDGRVLQKDLGPDGLAAAAAIDAYDPDPSWRPVAPETLRFADATAPEDAPFAGGLPPTRFVPAGTPSAGGPCRR
jgi:hypothetical protein